MHGRDAKHNVGDGDVGGDGGADALALRALVWTLAEPDRAMRLLSVTGLDPADLRTRLDDSAMLAAALTFLEQYEPDLIACAAALAVGPAALVQARETLERR